MALTLRTFGNANSGTNGEFEYNLPGCSAPVTDPAPPAWMKQKYCIKFLPADE
jgi:hypothetical protein